jgi:hypothetical protein
MKRTIAVVGVGTITAAPDIATVNVGVQVQAANAQDALRRANELTTAVLDAVRGLGLGDGDLRTNGPHLWPNERGYQCGNDLTIVVRDVSTTGSVIDVAAGDGERPRHRNRAGDCDRKRGRRGRPACLTSSQLSARKEVSDHLKQTDRGVGSGCVSRSSSPLGWCGDSAC